MSFFCFAGDHTICTWVYCTPVMCLEEKLECCAQEIFLDRMNDGSEARSVSPVNDISVSNCMGSFTSEFLGTHLLVATLSSFKNELL